MKALLHFSASSRFRFRLAELEQPRVVVVSETDDETFFREIADTDVLLHVLKPVTAAMISRAPKLKLIQKIGIGVNTIDRDAAERAGIAVANMPGTNTAAVAEHTLALMFAVLRRVAAFDEATRQGRGWSLPPDSREALGELNGSIVGLVGYGAIAQSLVRPLQALGAEVQFWNRTPRPGTIEKQVELDELLTTSDILSLHVPLTADTRHLLNRQLIARLKQGAIVVNTARGELIDQVALCEAIREGRIAGAGLDVFEQEPITDLAFLSACPTIIATPHIAWLTPQTIDRSLAVVVENCRRLGAGEPLLYAVRNSPISGV